MDKKVTISVIIPVHNGAATLGPCLKAVFESTYTDFEVLVSDDASQDTSREIAGSFPVKLLESANEKPGGAAAARNRVAREAVGKYLFFTDADVIIRSDTLQQMVDLFEREPDIHAIIGSYTFETPVTNFSSRFKNYLHHFTHQHSNEKAITFWTACGGILREVFQSAGGFNENYDTASVEDIAFGYKLTKLGYHIQLSKELQVTHLKQYTLRSMMMSDIFNRAIPWTRLMLRERIFRSDLNTSFSSGVGLLAAYMIAPLFLLGFFEPILLSAAVVMVCLFLFANMKLYSYIIVRVDIMFFIRFIGMSFLYYLYSGLGLMIALCGYARGRTY